MKEKVSQNWLWRITPGGPRAWGPSTPGPSWTPATPTDPCPAATSSPSWTTSTSSWARPGTWTPSRRPRPRWRGGVRGRGPPTATSTARGSTRPRPDTDTGEVLLSAAGNCREIGRMNNYSVISNTSRDGFLSRDAHWHAARDTRHVATRGTWSQHQHSLFLLELDIRYGDIRWSSPALWCWIELLRSVLYYFLEDY